MSRLVSRRCSREGESALSVHSRSTDILFGVAIGRFNPISVVGEADEKSVIMDVMNVEQAKIAEEAGASAVMALGESAGSRLADSAD